MIHITDGQSDEILDVIPDEDYWGENHHKSLKDTMETFNFTIFADKRYSQYLVKRNRVIISDDDGRFVEFIINEPIKYHDENGHIMEIYSQASYLEDLKKGKLIRPGKTGNRTNIQHVNDTLFGTMWMKGKIQYAGTRDLEIDNFTEPYSFSRRLASEFELELQFRIEIEGNKIIGRYMDMVERIGEWRGREVEFGKDLIGIRRRETGDIVTALLGIGPEREDGTRLEVLVEDHESLQRWGRGQHIIAVYEPQSMDSDMSMEELTRYTRTELNKRIKALIEYETTIANLESVPGLENQEIRFGDTIKTKDTHFNPPLYLEARIHSMDRSPKDKSKKRVALGDYIEYTEEEVQANWKALQAEISKKISQAQLEQFAEPKKVISIDPPEDKNVIWIKPTDSVYIPYSHDDSTDKWVKMSPTAANEINGVEKDKDYNGTKISETGEIKGLISISKDQLVRVILNGDYGFIAQERRSILHEWHDVLYFDFNTKKFKFAGEVDGVIGNFGQVEVKNGDLLLVDGVTGTRTVVRENSNMINDHSFELIRPNAMETPLSQTAGVFTVNPESLSSDIGKWYNTNPAFARIMVDMEGTVHTLYGNRAAVLRGETYGIWDQYLTIPEQVAQTKTLSFSCYVAPYVSTTYNVGVSLRLQLVNSNKQWVRDLASKEFTIDYTKKYNWQRISVTYQGSLELGGNLIRARLFLTNNNPSAMLLCDGVQVVPFAHPGLYYPEASFYRFMLGYDKAEQINSREVNATNGNFTELYADKINVLNTVTLGLSNNWQPYGGGTHAPRAIKDPTGKVTLEGVVRGGLVGSYTMATLPVGMRPTAHKFLKGGTYNNGLAEIIVYSDGAIRITAATNNTWVSLDGIFFYTI